MGRLRARHLRPPRRQVREFLARCDEPGGLPGLRLVAADYEIDIAGVEFDAAADATRPVRCDQTRTRAEKGVQDGVAAMGRLPLSAFFKR